MTSASASAYVHRNIKDTSGATNKKSKSGPLISQ